MKSKIIFVLVTIVAGLSLMVGPASAAQKKPNILVLWGDDIGRFNISTYNGGTIQAVGVTVEKAVYVDLEKEAQRAMMRD
jgi:hypothetical protein